MPHDRQQFLALIRRFEDLLHEKAKERAQFSQLVDHPLGRPYGTVCQWHIREMEDLLKAINEARAARSLAPIDLAQLAKVETWACGHVDYLHKLSLYASELALGYLPKP